MSTRTRLGMFLMMLCLSATPLVGQQTAEELLQAALYKQQVEGDLSAAIELLSTLAEDFSEHRAVAARALVQLGLAHETLGSTEAEHAYRRVVSDYPDQTEAAERARARLAVLSPEPGAEAEGLVARRRWSLPDGGVPLGAVSPDGRFDLDDIGSLVGQQLGAERTGMAVG